MKYFRNIIEECPMILPHNNVKMLKTIATIQHYYLNIK